MWFSWCHILPHIGLLLLATSSANGLANCTVSSLALPSYLQTSAGPSVASGQNVTITCSQSGTALKSSYSPYTRQCLNGTFQPSAYGASYPNSSDCVAAISCPIAYVETLHPPSNVYTAATADVMDGASINFMCTGNKVLDPALDPDNDNAISVKCVAGIFVEPPAWPNATQCLAVCTSIAVNVSSSGFKAIPLPIRVLQNSWLTLTCSDPTYFVNNDWTGNTYNLPCQNDGSFLIPTTWPTCGLRPRCPTPPLAPFGTGLVPINATATPEVTTSATYKCSNASLVTTAGATIDIPCTQQGMSAAYSIPAAWGTSTMKCRAKMQCGNPPVPPPNSGMTALTTPPTGIWEYDTAKYNCTTTSNVMYLNTGVKMSNQQFTITCLPPGAYESGVNWPYCDVTNPAKCTTFPSVPQGVPVSIVSNTSALPGGYVSYRCNDPTMITNLGAEVKVYCVKDWSDGSVSFQQPQGWASLTCVNSVYPNFAEPNCICLGDPILTAQQSNQILDNICRDDNRTTSDNMVVPFKQRCGVKDLLNIVDTNKCYCSEDNENGVDFAVWSIGELVTYKWKANFSDPDTDDFISLQSEIQTEVDRLILESNPAPMLWRYVRSYVFNFLPGKALACSMNVIPVPPPGSGLVVKQKKTVQFNDSIQYVCIQAGLVTNDGPTFNLVCQSNGQFQNRVWLPCRQPVVCVKPPPFPPASSLLAASTSTYVNENDNAIYKCQNPAYIVPNTTDGTFGTPCKRTASFNQANAIAWPTCIPKPKNICSPIPTAPAGYVITSSTLGYVVIGNVITVACANQNMLIGNDVQISYPCVRNADNTTSFLGLNLGALPVCRLPATCSPSQIPPPSTKSGLAKPLQSQSFQENQYVEYVCSQGSPYSLYGTYSSPSQFNASGAMIAGGKLRVYCLAGGVMGTVNVWPTCRDSSLTRCPISAFPAISSFGLVAPPTSPVLITSSVTIRCQNSGQVTNYFSTASVTCNYDGTFSLPYNLTACRAAKTCPTSPTPPAATKLQIIPFGSPLKEFDVQQYGCSAGYTLQGVVNPLIVNGFVNLVCNLDASNNFIVPASWPSCLPTASSCNTIPILAGFNTQAVGPVTVGDTISYSCNTPGAVTDLGAQISLTCTNSGLFSQYATMPTCRAPLPCQTTPVPASTTNLQPSTSTGLVEWDFATYSCSAGTALDPSVADSNGNFNVQCGLDGVFPSINWPVCGVSQCMQVSAVSGFTTTSTAPIAVGDYVGYICVTAGQIANNSLGPVMVRCNSDGTLGYPSPFPQCRSRVSCQTVLPVPPNSTYLNPSSSSLLKEFDNANYSCKAGASFSGASSNIVDGQFQVQCLATGIWPNATSISWPTCQVNSCPVIPSISFDYSILSTAPIPVGNVATYGCSGINYVMDIGTTFNAVCLNTGNIQLPSPVPTCRQAVMCGANPTPPAGTNLLPSQSTNVYEFQSAAYNCSAGMTLAGVSNPGIVNGIFYATCHLSGTFNASSISWPTCVTTSGRKKRDVAYNLNNDIDYTVLVLLEVQFMYTDGIEADIRARTNITKNDFANFPIQLVSTFHALFNSILGPDLSITSDLTFGSAFQPLCDQPTNANMTGLCIPTNTPAVCSKTILEGAWLESLGFTYQQQSPLWTNESVFDYNTPIGSAVQFYCSNKQKRPHTDTWDSNPNDGIISSYCDHQGVFSITMNPPDWDYCLSQCPIAKPIPPVAPGAQLIPYDSDQKWQRQLWQGELINYGCENTTLLLDIGNVSVAYACLDGGVYATPSGLNGSNWPVCEVKPISPYIFVALATMTETFDQNAEYRYQLSIGNGSDIKFLTTSKGIMSITVPIIASIIIFVFLVMCCTRANSPICKIFEPKA